MSTETLEPGSLEAGLLDAVRLALSRSGAPLSPQAVAEALRATGRPVGDATVLAVHERLVRDAVGAGPLEPLLRLPGVTDVLVNGAGAVHIDRGAGLERVALDLGGEPEVRRLAQRLAAAGGRRLDDAVPHVDVRLADGTRLHAVLAPVARPGTLISLRVPSARPLALDDLVAAGTLTPGLARVVRALIRTRVAFLVTGGTGTGKTTLLGSLLGLVPPAERIVVVEDAAELRPDHPHVVGLEGRVANVEGAGALDLRLLVRQALRMRPDRLVVGEVRGAEVVDLLAALNTGHDGGCGTVHANSAADVPARLEALALAAGLDRAAVHSQLASGVGAVLHLARDARGHRRLAEIALPHRGRDGWVEMRTALRHRRVDGRGRIDPGPAADELAALVGATAGADDGAGAS